MLSLRTLLLTLMVGLASCTAVSWPDENFTDDRSIGGVAYAGGFMPGRFERVPRDAPIRITYSMGGKIKGAEELYDRPVILDGFCASACARLIVLSDKVCFTKRASFLFHTSRYTWKFLGLFVVRIPAYGTTKELLDAMRPELRKKVGRIMFSWEDIHVDNEFMRGVYPDRYCPWW